jgi:uncharacterized protein YgbK (DUF1537 family)
MIYVIADDLTGAAEIAGICRRYGLYTTLTLGEVKQTCDTEALVIATETRQMSLEKSEEVTRQLAESLPHEVILFKKTDSALRGHVAEELGVLLEYTTYDRALFLPANPSRGRTLRNGVYYIDNVPLDKTPFSHDPEYPAWSAKMEGRFPCISLWSGERGKGIYYCNATNDEDIVQAVKQTDEKTLLAGGADFFFTFLCSLGYQEREDTLITYPSTNSAIMVCGSTQSKGIAGWPCSMMPVDTYEGKADSTLWAEEALAQIEHNGHTQLRIEGHSRRDASGASYLRLQTADAVTLLMERHPVREIFIEGGATAYAILHKMGWTTLAVDGELAPGVVRLLYQDIGITIKPGSYPWPWT